MSENGEQDGAERAYAEHAQAKELPAVDFLNLDAPRADTGGCVLLPGERMEGRFGWLPENDD